MTLTSCTNIKFAIDSYNVDTAGVPMERYLTEEDVFAIIKSIGESSGLNFENNFPDIVAVDGIKLYDAKKQVAVIYDENKLTGEAYITSDDIAIGVLYNTKWKYPKEYRLFEEFDAKIEEFIRGYYDVENIEGYLYGTGYVPFIIDFQLIDEYREIRTEYKSILEQIIEMGNDKLYNSYNDAKKKYDDKLEQIISAFNNVSHETYDEYKRLNTEYEENLNRIWWQDDEEQLREQVRDFIEWLQGQGII